MTSDEKLAADRPVLIVDDDPAMRTTIKALVEDAGYRVFDAKDGIGALEMFDRVRPCLILTDLGMPRMDGLTLIARLRLLAPDTPIIAISGVGIVTEAIGAIRAGAWDYVEKPILNFESLELVITRVMERSRLITENKELQVRLAEQTRLASMGELLQNIAHQWRQPLNQIGMILQSSQSDYGDGSKDQSHCKNCVAEALGVLTSLSATIDNFSTFYQPIDDSRPFELDTAVERSALIMQPNLDEYGIGITLTLTPSIPVSGVPAEFARVIVNIIDNAKNILIARKIVNPKIEITLRRSGERALITISDNGGGIDGEVMPKIFEPYFTTGFQSPGAGSGLYVAKMIIERHMGGSLAATNAGDGVQFTIALPIGA